MVMLRLYLLMKLVREEMFICRNTLAQGSLSQIGKEILEASLPPDIQASVGIA